jgi:hypothetical protein
MRAFAAFMALIGAGLVAMAILAYPAWLLVTPHLDVPFHRVASRIGMLTLLIGFVLLARRLGLADRASLGYGRPRRAFLREMAVAFALGVALMLPVVGLMLALDLRVARPGLALDASALALLAVDGITSGIAVALIEETFLRGAMFTGIQRESGTRLAVVLTALVYSATHFIGRYRIPAAEVDAGSGLELLGGALQAFANFSGIADAFLCLFAVGVLLGLVRARTGDIAACIGLHAGWVFVIAFLRKTSTRDESSELAFLLSRFDGVVGWLVLAWTLVIGAALVRVYRRRAEDM